mmetsp:Transcript_84145/g.181475  ORF Transcript_84145/g.181475 Transcript_84145/m.181475 type:complete len:206 (-) Transcript_84145:1610-2227(-)
MPLFRRYIVKVLHSGGTFFPSPGSSEDACICSNSTLLQSFPLRSASSGLWCLRASASCSRSRRQSNREIRLPKISSLTKTSCKFPPISGKAMATKALATASTPAPRSAIPRRSVSKVSHGTRLARSSLLHSRMSVGLTLMPFTTWQHDRAVSPSKLTIVASAPLERRRSTIRCRPRSEASDRAVLRMSFMELTSAPRRSSSTTHS